MNPDCIKTDQNVLNYRRSNLNMIRLLILVQHLIFGDFCIWGDILVLNICLKNEFVKSCFQQTAKCKMTVQTVRKHHVFSRNSTL